MASKALSEQQVQFYRDNGYLLIHNVVDEAMLHRLRDVTATFIDESRTVTASNPLYDVGPDHCADHPQVRRVKNPHQHHSVYEELAHSNVLVDIVASLLGPHVRFDHSKLNFKPPGTATAIEWHQDWAFYPHTNDDILAVGVLLEDCADENGPLLVIPGSHQGAVYDHHRDGVFVGAIHPRDLDINQDDVVALTGKAGAITIHHVRTVHGSADNFSQRSRPLMLLSYAAVDAWPLIQTCDLDEFDSRVLRGEPTLSPRQLNLPIRIPLPRVPGTDGIFDDQASVLGRSFGDAAKAELAQAP